MKRILAMLFSIAMLASACSGGDGLAIETADGDSATSADSSDEDATAEERSSSSNSSSGGDWCGRAIALDERMENLESTDELESISQVRDSMQSMLSDAPNEIKGDFAIMLEGMDLMVDIFEDAGGEIFDADLSALAELSDAKYEDASNNIENYLEETCGLDFSESDVDVDDIISDDGNSGYGNSDDENITIPNGILDAFKDLGMSDEDADCIVESMIANGVDAEDASAFFDSLETCGLSMADLAEPGS